MGNSPEPEASASGSVCARQVVPTLPVRVGVPPEYCEDEPVETFRRRPAIVSTLPESPFGSFGVFSGSATSCPAVPVR